MSEQNGPNRLAEYRRKAGLVQEDLAQAMGVRSATISRWERGISFPNLRQLHKLARLLEATVDDLFPEPERVA